MERTVDLRALRKLPYCTSLLCGLVLVLFTCVARVHSFKSPASAFRLQFQFQLKLVSLLNNHDPNHDKQTISRSPLHLHKNNFVYYVLSFPITFQVEMNIQQTGVKWRSSFQFHAFLCPRHPQWWRITVTVTQKQSQRHGREKNCFGALVHFSS